MISTRRNWSLHHPSGECEEHGADEANGETGQHLHQGVLAEDDAAGAHQSGEEDEDAAGQQGVEEEKVAQGEIHACESAHAHHVDADFPPEVDKRAYHLSHKRCQHDVANEQRHVGLVHQQQTCGVGDERQHVRHVQVTPMAHLPARETVGMPENHDADPWYYYSERKDHYQDEELIVERKQFEVAEQEEPDQRPQRHVERGENH